MEAMTAFSGGRPPHPIVRQSRRRDSVCLKPICTVRSREFLEAQGYEVKGEIGPCDVMAVRGDEGPVVVELKGATLARPPAAGCRPG